MNKITRFDEFGSSQPTNESPIIREVAEPTGHLAKLAKPLKDSLGFIRIEHPDFSVGEDAIVFEKEVENQKLRVVLDSEGETNACRTEVFMFDKRGVLIWDAVFGFGTPVSAILKFFELYN
jgi:hypothetical protein